MLTRHQLLWLCKLNLQNCWRHKIKVWMSSSMLKINAGIKTEANIWIKDTAVKSVTKFCLY